MISLAVFALLVHHVPGPAEPAAFATLVGAIIVFEFLTAAVLFEQLWSSGAPALAPLATAYLCTGLLVAAYLLTFPNVVTPTGLLNGNGQSSSVFWCAWHTVLPLLVMLFAWASRKPAETIWPVAVTRVIVVASVIFSVGVTTLTYQIATRAAFPTPLVENGLATPLALHAILPAICFLDVACLAMLVLTGLRTTAQLWLFVVMLAALLEAITGAASPRYAVGWDISKIFAFASSSFLLSAFVFEVTRLYRRLTVAQDELMRARDAAQDGAKAKMQFLATMSHEIRTPINAIIGMNELLSQTRLDDEQREFAAVVHASADVLLSVINQVLDYSRLEAGKLKLDEVEFDPRVVCETSVDTIAGQAQAKGLAVAMFVDPSLPTRIRGDEVRLRQVLNCVLSNAVKFTERGYISVRAELETATEDSDILRFTVCDTGIGIAASTKKNLFSAFVQGDTSTTRRFGGTGLGLSIAKRIADAMQGSIEVQSEEGQGTRITFTARARRVQAASLPAPAHVGRVGARVLLLCDHAAVSDDIGAYIRGWGGTCRCESTAAEARGATDAYDTVIVDVTGQDAEKAHATGLQLRALFPASTKLIALVGYDVQMDRQTDEPFFAVLRAPAHRQALFAALRASTEERSPSDPAPSSDHAEGMLPCEPLRVLVVDDNAMNCKLAVKQLSKLGIDADAVSDGALAIEAIASRRYPVILMDCQMPNVDGYEATRRIRALENGTSRCTIIAMTAGTLPGDRQECLDAGMDDYLAKPVTLQALETMLQTWVPFAFGSHSETT
jgi:two-component system sensor histidine kinase/response regulator